MTIDRYHPIRQRMVWVLVIQSVVNALTIAGIAATDLDAWANWLLGVLNILVFAGVLSQGTSAAEENTTPLTDSGVPLNPQYSRTE